MTYRDTARAFAEAEVSSHPAFASVAAKLPMSQVAERGRHTMMPQAIARNHMLYVEYAADALRSVLDYAAKDEGMVTDAEMAGLIAERARALLAAIGEGE